jgi:hypothetical protein
MIRACFIFSMIPTPIPMRGPGGSGPRNSNAAMRGPMGRGDYGKSIQILFCVQFGLNTNWDWVGVTMPVLMSVPPPFIQPT